MLWWQAAWGFWFSSQGQPVLSKDFTSDVSEPWTKSKRVLKAGVVLHFMFLERGHRCWMSNTVRSDCWPRSWHVTPTLIDLISVAHYFQNKLMWSLPHAHCIGRLWPVPGPEWRAQMTGSPLAVSCTFNSEAGERFKCSTAARAYLLDLSNPLWVFIWSEVVLAIVVTCVVGCLCVISAFRLGSPSTGWK